MDIATGLARFVEWFRTESEPQASACAVPRAPTDTH